MPSHSERCRSLNYFGSGEDFDCICRPEPPVEAPRRAPAMTTPLASPLAFGEGLEAMVARGIEPASQRGAQLWYFRVACDTAMDSGCLKSRCGAVLVNVPLFLRPGQESLFQSSLVAVGFNGPPQHDPAYRRCGETTPSLKHPKAGRTCCVHAEARALISAPRDRIEGATLYFARVGPGGDLEPSGRPWCTECSKLALDLGVSKWVLWHADGPREYEAFDYDRLSNDYDEEERRGRERGESSDFHADQHPAERSEHT